MNNQIIGSPQVAVQVRDVNGGDVHIHTKPLAPVSVPRQLPAPRLFLDRDQARAWLEHAWHTRHGPLWAGVEGPSGIGKTALVTAWGHQHRDRWPDGALYTDLTHTNPETALRGWLIALGHTHPPEDSSHLRALWRTTTSHKRLLVVIEHATPDTAQDLLPAGPDCAGITTAHHGLTRLITAGGRFVRLAALPDETVAELITRLLDRPPPASVLQDAVQATGGLPLAATLTAAALTRNFHAPLTEQETVVPQRINQILQQLPEQTVSDIAMLAAFPGPFLTEELAATILNTNASDTHHLLRELTEATLLVDAGQDRYTVHDQVRPVLTQHLTPETRHRMIDRAARFYRLRAAAVGMAINPWRWRVDTEGLQQAITAQKQGTWLTNQRTALTWADTHLDNLLALSHVLADLGRPEPWQYADHLGPYIIARKPMEAAHKLYQLGLDAARTLGPKRAEGLMYQRWASLIHYRTEAETPTEEAGRLLDYAEKALSAYRQDGHQRGIASALETLGGAYRAMGKLDRAAETFAESERLNLDIGAHRGAAMQRRKRAEMADDQGHLQEAATLWGHAHRTLLGLDRPDLYQAGRALQGLTQAVIAHGQGDTLMLALVEMLCHQGLTGARMVGSIHQEAGLRITLADLAHLRGDRDREEEELQYALVLLEPTGHPQTEEVRQRLGTAANSS